MDSIVTDRASFKTWTLQGGMELWQLMAACQGQQRRHTDMSNSEIVKNKYKSLRFNSIASCLDRLVKQAHDNEISYLQFAEMLVDNELGKREENKIRLNMRRAGFPVQKELEEFDFTFQTTISKKQIVNLLDFGFIDNRESVVFIGPPGDGKTHLAISVGVKAVETGYKVFFTTALTLVESLDLAEARGELKKKINWLLKFDLVIVDELGYLPLSQKSVFNFFQFINALVRQASLAFLTGCKSLSGKV